MAILIFHPAPSYLTVFIIITVAVMGLIASISLIFSGLRGLLRTETPKVEGGATHPVLGELVGSAKGVVFRAAIQEKNSADQKRRGAPVLRVFLKSAKSAIFRAAIQKRNSADQKRRWAPLLRVFLRSAKGTVFRAAIQKRNSADQKRRGAPVLRELLKNE